jgi:hypothetical protein
MSCKERPLSDAVEVAQGCVEILIKILGSILEIILRALETRQTRCFYSLRYSSTRRAETQRPRLQAFDDVESNSHSRSNGTVSQDFIPRQTNS